MVVVELTKGNVSPRLSSSIDPALVPTLTRLAALCQLT